MYNYHKNKGQRYMLQRRSYEEPLHFWCCVCRLTLTPLSLRSGVRGGAMGVRLLGGLNILGVVGLRNGALGIPLRGAGGTNHRGYNPAVEVRHLSSTNAVEGLSSRTPGHPRWALILRY